MKEPMLTYLINMMTSWAVVCDVWYMPPTTIQVQLSVQSRVCLSRKLQTYRYHSQYGYGHTRIEIINSFPRLQCSHSAVVRIILPKGCKIMFFSNITIAVLL